MITIHKTGVGERSIETAKVQIDQPLDLELMHWIDGKSAVTTVVRLSGSP